MKFDAKQAKLMQPDDVMTLDDFPGLRLLATKTGHTWTYRYKSPVDSRLRQIKLGGWPAMSLAEAIATWEKHRGARAGGADVVLAKRTVAKPVETVYTVRHLCLDYLAGHVDHNRNERNAQQIRRLVMKSIGPIADMPPEGVTRRVAFGLLEAMSNTPDQAVKLRGELGAAWEHGHDAGRLSDDVPNWWKQIMHGKLKSKGRLRGGKRSTGERVLTDTEITEMAAWIPVLGANTMDAFHLYLWTATRGAEIVSMEGREVSEEKNGLWWTIPKVKTKNARFKYATDLRVPLVGRAESIVRRRMKTYGKGFLFPSANHNRQHITQAAVTTSVGRCQPYWQGDNKANYDPPMPVTHWALHDLRRTARTMLASLGCPDEIGEAIIGHMPPGIVGVYNKYKYDTERREWLTRLATRLEELVS